MLLPSRLGILGHLLIPLSLFLLNLSNSAQAYIPALPTNDTNAVNRTDVSRLSFFWVEGSYSADISLQLTADANTSDFFPNYYAEGGVDRVSRSAAESTGEESGANSGRLPSARLARSGSSRLLFVSQYVPFPSFRLKTRPEGETGNKLTFPLPPRNRRLSPPFHSASQ
jgi:hypothetical protein